MPVEPLLKFDLPDIAAIESLSPQTSWTESKIRSSLDHAATHGIVWRESGKVAAYALYSMTPPTAELLNIVTHPDHRRSGIAQKMLSRILEEAQRHQCSEMLLEVRVSNHAAIQLYYGFGFRQISVRKKYYQDGEDALIMRALLT